MNGQMRNTHEDWSELTWACFLKKAHKPAKNMRIPLAGLRLYFGADFF